jgi:hypothetical protein
MLLVKDQGLEAIARALTEKGISMPVPLKSVIIKS